MKENRVQKLTHLITHRNLAYDKDGISKWWEIKDYSKIILLEQ